MNSAVPQAPVRNKTFYMDISIFQVENDLFRIPTSYLKKYSAIFHQMPSLNAHPGPDAAGQSDANPIKLEGVSKVEFERFLTVVGKYEVEPSKSFDATHWLSVLKLANLWGFSDLRKTAITKLSSEELRRASTATARLHYGRLHKVEQWVEQAYTELVDRREKISEGEAELIGWKVLLKLCHLREDFHGSPKTATAVAPTNSAVSPASQPFVFSPNNNIFGSSLPKTTSSSGGSGFGAFGGGAFGAPPLSPGPFAASAMKKEPPATSSPTPPTTSLSAVRQAFAAELKEIREAGTALNVPPPRAS
ncbi:BTB domain-containing protein [Pleurotus pulmonarius]